MQFSLRRRLKGRHQLSSLKKQTDPFPTCSTTQEGSLCTDMSNKGPRLVSERRLQQECADKYPLHKMSTLSPGAHHECAGQGHIRIACDSTFRSGAEDTHQPRLSFHVIPVTTCVKIPKIIAAGFLSRTPCVRIGSDDLSEN